MERAAAAGGRASARRAAGRGFGREPKGVDPADQDPISAAREICLRQLTLGPRTKAQLVAALARRGVEEEVAEQVLGRLAEVGLVDDAAFAAAWVESRHAGRGLARKALAHELRRRGVADPVVDGAVADLDPERELETAREHAVRRLAASRGLDPAVRFRRAAGTLARKGYSQALAYRVVREALEAEAGGADGADGAGGLDEALDGFDPDADDF